MSDDPLWPQTGDLVTFRAPVFVGTSSGERRVTSGLFLWWVDCAGDAIAIVQTPCGDANVRWSIIEGISGPAGLLDR